MDKDYVISVIYAKEQDDDRLIKDGDFIDFELFKALCECPRKHMYKAFYRYDTLRNSKGIFFRRKLSVLCAVVTSREVFRSRK